MVKGENKLKELLKSIKNQLEAYENWKVKCLDDKIYSNEKKNFL